MVGRSFLHAKHLLILSASLNALIENHASGDGELDLRDRTRKVQSIIVRGTWFASNLALSLNIVDMAQPDDEVAGSSTSHANPGLKAQSNGTPANYELPW